MQFLCKALIFLTFTFYCGNSNSQDYPSQPITFVVGFGIGGSVDRMTRAMSVKLSENLGQPVQVINKRGAGTLLAAKYVLDKPSDGYTVFASAFTPYLTNTILEGNANYSIDDFAYINFQWFETDIIALYGKSRFNGLGDLLEEIRTRPNTVRAAVVRGSAGHLMAKLILEANNIPPSNLNLVAYNSGGLARAAVAGGVVDFIVISEEGTRSIKDYIKPLAIVSDQASEFWGVPALNDALEPLGASSPLLPGSVRGFATSAKFKQDYPERFNFLAEAIKNTLIDPELLELMNKGSIGARWTGPEKSTQTMNETFDIFVNYSYLLGFE